MTLTPKQIEQLSAPFPPEAVHWRAQVVASRSGSFSALALAYIDARDVMDRLDEVCGPAGWQDSYTETARGRVIGTISINCDGVWISKSDGAGDTDVEGEKGGLSDACKRAAVKWGIGRYLYRLGNTWADCEVVMKDGQPLLNRNNKPTFKEWTPRGRAQLADALKALASQREPNAADKITDATRDWISDQLAKRKLEALDLCGFMGVTSLKDLTYGDIQAVKDWLANPTKKEG